MICKNCGEKLSDGVLFCEYCGMKNDLFFSQDVIKQESSNAVNINTENKIEKEIQNNIAKGEPRFQGKSFNLPNIPTSLIIIVCVIVFIALGGFIFSKVKKDDKPEQNGAHVKEKTEVAEQVTDLPKDNAPEEQIEENVEEEIVKDEDAEEIVKDEIVDEDAFADVPDYENPEYMNGHYGRSNRVSVLDFKAPQPIDGLEVGETIPVQYFDPSIHEYQLFVEDITYTEAEQKCQNMGGHLVTVICKEEANIISGFLKDIKIDQSKVPFQIWMGCYISDDNVPQLPTNENPGVSYWAPGELNRVDPVTGEVENYSIMFYDAVSDMWLWRDVVNDISSEYSGKIAYLCEWEVITDENYYEVLRKR